MLAFCVPAVFDRAMHTAAIEAGRQYEVLAAAKAVAVRVVLVIEALTWRMHRALANLQA
jgi:hypothetical protein